MTFEMRDKLPDDHPIKRGMVVFVPRRTNSSATPSPPEASLPDPNADPMQPAIDQIERALRAKDDRAVAEANARATGKPSTGTASPSPESTTPESSDKT